MNRRALSLVAVVAALGAACGGLVEEDVSMGSAAAGTGAQTGTEFEAAAQADATDARATRPDGGVESAAQMDAGTVAGRQQCPEWQGAIDWDLICYWQLLEPAGPDGRRALVVPCEISCSGFLLNSNENRVYVDCQPIPFVLYPPDEPVSVGEFWWFDNPQAPRAIVLSDALCSRVSEHGFERIDVLYASPPRSIP